MSTGVVTETETVTTTQTIPPWNVVLLNDEEHTYEYVIEMLTAVFGLSKGQGYARACEVDAAGRSVIITTSREHAELKQEQVHSYGKDKRIFSCAGSMSCIIEPAN